jgi:hypothetical protein
MKQKYYDECAAAATFLEDATNRCNRFYGNQENLADEEVRRGPVGLGIVEPPKPKVEKKAEKVTVAAVVKPEQIAKELKNAKKKVVKWWIKIERRKGCHCDEQGVVFPWFHGR